MYMGKALLTESVTRHRPPSPQVADSPPRAVCVTAVAVMAAFPGSTPFLDATLWAGVAHELSPAYAATLPPGLAEAIVAAAPEWQWGPCTVCGEGKLVPRPPKPMSPRDIGSNDGPACMFTKDCEGRHYPLDGPLPHPLARRRPELAW